MGSAIIGSAAAVRRRVNSTARAPLLAVALATGLLGATFAAQADELPDSPLEKPVCGWIERFAFWNWTRAVRGLPRHDVQVGPEVQAVSHVTNDGRTLKGFHLSPDAPGLGTILVAQGNGMRADTMLPLLRVLTKQGYDVYVFDFRGFGASNGTARLQAIVSDYGELVDMLSARTPELYLYGISFGGIILANAAGNHVGRYKALAIDSSPSDLAQYDCPARFGAIANIPASAADVLVITGAHDTLVRPEASRALVDEIVARGGQWQPLVHLGHPFMDGTPSDAADRLRMVSRFFDKRNTRSTDHDK